MFYFMTEKLFKFKTLLVKFWTGIVCNCDTYISIIVISTFQFNSYLVTQLSECIVVLMTVMHLTMLEREGGVGCKWGVKQFSSPPQSFLGLIFSIEFFGSIPGWQISIHHIIFGHFPGLRGCINITTHHSLGN